MAINTELIMGYIPGMVLIAALCYGFTVALRKVKALTKNRVFVSWLPIIPGIHGAMLGLALALADSI